MHPGHYADTTARTNGTNAETRDRTGDLQIFSLTLSQLSYRGDTSLLKCLHLSSGGYGCLSLSRRAAPGIEPGTSRTQTENHATRPSSHRVFGMVRHVFRRRRRTIILWGIDHLYFDTGYSSVGRASDCRRLQQSDGPWFDSGWPEFDALTLDCSTFVLIIAKRFRDARCNKFRHRDSNPGRSGESRVS